MYPSESEPAGPEPQEQAKLRIALAFPAGFSLPTGENLPMFAQMSGSIAGHLNTLIRETVPESERNQVFTFHLENCDNPKCSLLIPHVIGKIVTEVELSETALVAISKVAGPDVTALQVGPVIVFHYK